MSEARDARRAARVRQRVVQAEERVRRRLDRVARTRLPIIVGPWTGEVGFELLYWIPFLQWARETARLGPERLIVLSRGGVRDWYGHVTSNYDDIFTHVSTARFQQAGADRKKQEQIRPFDCAVVRSVMRARGIRHAHLLHPALMYGLYKAYWRQDATLTRLEDFAIFRPLTATPAPVAPSDLPSDYVAVRFYFSSCFPDTPATRQFAASVIEALAARYHVVLLNNDISVDDHADFAPGASARIHTLSAEMQPETNLAVQTAIIRGARAFVGTYGGYSYLAPLCGVSAVAYYSRPAFKQHHLDLAQRVFQRLGRARLLPIAVEQAGLASETLARVEGLPS